MKITASQFVRRQARKQFANNVVDGRVASPHIVRKLTENLADRHKPNEVIPKKIVVSLAPEEEGLGDLESNSTQLFNCNLQCHRDTVLREAKRNLQRRMLGYDITVFDVSGDGHVDFSVSRFFGTTLLTAVGLAAPQEVALTAVTIRKAGEEHIIEPARIGRSPENTVAFLEQLLNNQEAV